MTPEAAREARERIIEAMARAMLLADDGGNADAIMAATEHDGDCLNLSYTCSLCQADYYRTLARAAYDAAVRAMEVEGVVCVPLVPTAVMLNALSDAIADGGSDERKYRAMIAARPQRLAEREGAQGE